MLPRAVTRSPGLYPVDPRDPVILSNSLTKPAYTKSAIDRNPIGSRLVNGSPYRTPIVFPQ